MTARSKFWDMIEETDVCMMVSQGADGLHARPMHAIVERDDRQLWFFTRLDSGKSEELQQDGEVCLCFAAPRQSDFVSVSGEAALVQDRERIDRYWSRFVDAWFPEGKDSDVVGLIRVDVSRGEYWDGESSNMLAALKMLRASQMDETPDLGENRKVSL